MSNGTPFTSGKNSAREGAKPGGMFTKGTGGHTSRGHVPPAGTKPGASTAASTTHIGTLKKRMTGANGTKGMPK